jgi:hypothetical protein
VVESIFAYENGGLQTLMEQQKEEASKLRNLEKIAEIQAEIFSLESEIQKETNVAKMKKMDRQIEQLYEKKAYLELGNTGYIKNMASTEFKQEWIETNQKITENKMSIEANLILKDEVQMLTQQAQAEMVEAEALRLAAGSKTDVIEKNDYFRQAFAKEMHAISLLEKSRTLIDNASLLANYNPVEMADLRTGNAELVAENRIAALQEADQKASEKATPEFVPYLTEDGTAEVIFVSNNKTLPTKKTDEAATAPDANSAPTPVTTEPTVITEAPATEAPEETTALETTPITAAPTEETEPTKPVIEPTVVEVPTAQNTQETPTVNETAIEQPVKTETQTTANENARKEETEVVTETVVPAPKPTLTSPVVADNKITKEELDNLGIVLAPPTAQPEAPNTPTVTEAPVVTTAPKSEANTATVPAQPSTEVNAEEFIYTFPTVVISDYFTLTKNAAYSTAKPIPVDAPMPEGIYYKIQVGAFRTSIPQNLYDEFAPVSGESVGNGLVRYSAGFFKTYDRADQVKMDIRRMGYSDAFVVAYKDGKRIPIYEAIRTTEKNPEAELSKETTNAPAPTSVSTPATKDVASYYKGVPNAAPAVQVETTKGLFYTVQVGVYSKPTPASKLYNIAPLNSELTANQKIRYTAGRFTSLQDAVNKRAEARRLGLQDAFITVYYNGKRITMSEADALLKEQGNSILYKEQ